MFSLVFGTGLYTLPVAQVAMSVIMGYTDNGIFRFSKKVPFQMCLIHDNWQWHRLGECSWGRRHLALYGAPQVYEPMRAFPYQPEVTQWPHISSLILPPWLDTEESWYSSCGTLYSKSPRLNSIIMVKWAKNIFWVECGNNLVSITYCTTSLIS